MTHPEKEQLAAFIYNECTPKERKLIQEHLAQCGACSQLVNGLTHTQKHLNRWTVRKPLVLSSFARPIAAAAASLLLGITFFAGHKLGATATQRQVEKLKPQIEQFCRERIEEELVATQSVLQQGIQVQFAATLAEQRQEMLKLLEIYDANRQQDLAALRQDLETVAVHTENRWRRTQVAIGQLVSFTSQDTTQSQP
jgi:hypothetical protein